MPAGVAAAAVAVALPPAAGAPCAWAGLIGGRWEHDQEHGWAGVEEIPGAPFDYLVFVPVAEPKTVKNRIHWDVETTDLDLLTAYGARVVRARDDEIGWTVLADPEGNEFCAFEA